MPTSLSFPTNLGSTLKDVDGHFIRIGITDVIERNIGEKERAVNKVVIYLPMIPVSNNISANWSVLNKGITSETLKRLTLENMKSISSAAEGFSLTGLVNNVAVIDRVRDAINNVTDTAIPGGLWSVDFAKNYAVERGLQLSSYIPDAQAIFQGNAVSLRNFQAQMFDGMNFRGLGLSWQLVASNKNESNAIKEIEKEIKSAMHPTINKDFAVMYDYPKLFQLDFMSVIDGQPTENQYMPRFAPMVLNDATFGYNEGRAPSFFADSGAAVTVNISLAFTETKLLFRDDIEKDIYR